MARARAPFLAQLIATAQQAPQSRNRRRASVAEGERAYAAALRAGRPAGARGFRRCV